MLNTQTRPRATQRTSRPLDPSPSVPPASRVRLAPVPLGDPPLLAGSCACRGPQEDLCWPGQEVLAFPPPSPSRGGVGPWVDPVVASRPSADGDLSDPGPTCATLALAVVEVLSGRRPAAQLARWTTLEVHEGLTRRAALVSRLRPTARERASTVHRTHVSRPAEGVVEASATILDNGRVRAVAMRLEGWDRRWRATAVEVG